MVTLIAVYGSDGCEGRCDSRCYEARDPSCDCVCGGKNHGAGFDQAVSNTRELADSWLEAAQARGTVHGEVPDWVRTLPMFESVAP